jgi:hypothetical protein
MSALATLETGLLLGLYAMLAGIWGVLYALARLRLAVSGRSAAAAYGLHGVAALIILLWTPLALGWKCLIAGSSLVVLLCRRSSGGFWSTPIAGSKRDRQPPEHSVGIVARLQRDLCEPGGRHE